MRTLFLTTAVAALTAGIAVAQDTSPTVAPEAGAAAPPTADGTGMAMYGDFADTPVRDIVGQSVLARDGADVGEVETLFLSGDRVMAVVGVGGFLGIGEHDVALPLTDFVATDQGLMLAEVSQEDLEAMPEVEGDFETLSMDVTVAGAPVGEPAIVPDPQSTGTLGASPATTAPVDGTGTPASD